MTVLLTIGQDGPRRCGDCQLCCKLVPVKELGKRAGERCRHQRHRKGCAVYHQPAAGFPPSCGLWNCRWLANADETATLRRPDRAHYVLDVLPDFVTVHDGAAGTAEHLEVVQVWVDPDYPDAHRDPALRAYLERLADTRSCPALVRWDNARGMVLFAPSLSANRQWNEVHSGLVRAEHSFGDVVAALGGGA